MIDKDLLVLTMEECSELSQICSKIYRFGVEAYHPKNGVTNYECLIEEIGDVVFCLTALAERYGITQEQISSRLDVKSAKVEKYFK